MERGIGEILREARKRREVELSEVEAATKIRLKYLRAIEDEDWAVLPGDVYARGFIRTYASFLGLDGERLASEYRELAERRRGAQGEPRDLAIGAAGRARGPASRVRPGMGPIVVAGVILVAVVAIVAMPVGEDGGGGNGGELSTTARRPLEETGERRESSPRLGSGDVSMTLTTDAEVWVCVLDESGDRLVDGQILEAGAEEGPFHSGSFTVSFGNGEVSMHIDGKEADIPVTPSPLGYAIDAEGKMTRLSESARPTCA